jgi:cellulose biosynthesis protein BcsQ
VARELILKNWLEDNRAYLEANFDILLIDTPPHFNVICQNAFIISDSILLINNVSINSLEGAEQFCALWRAIRLQLRLPNNVDGFIINRASMSHGIDKDFYDHVKTHAEFSSILFETYIPNLVAYVNTELENQPINYIKPSNGLKKSQIIQAQEYIFNLENELNRRMIL